VRISDNERGQHFSESPKVSISGAIRSHRKRPTRNVKMKLR